MRKVDFFIIGLIALFLSGCRLKRPDDVLSSKKMEHFLYDYHLAQAISQDLPKEEKYTTNAYIDWAYEKNNITKEQFNRSLVWYTRYPKELAKIYKRLSNRIDDEYGAVARSLALIEKKSFTIQSGDSVNLWYLDRTALLNSSVYMNKLTYRVNKDTTFHKGDTVRLNMHGTFISVDTCVPHFAYVSLSAYYNDGMSTSDTIIKNDGQLSLSVILDSRKEMSYLSGSINYMDSTDNRQVMLVLSDMEMIRYHRKGQKIETDIPSVDSVIVDRHSPAEL